MWVRVDDGFVEHPKVITAAGHLGRNGVGRVVAVWLEALCYAARNLTDGLVPILIARKFTTDRRPLEVLDVMARPDVRLMTKTDKGYRFHDFGHYQPAAAVIKEKRQRDRDRKSMKESARNRGGIATDSARISNRIRQDSARIPNAIAKDSTSHPNGIAKEFNGIAQNSAQIPRGIRAESARNPERSRARDPVLDPKDQDQEQCADAHASRSRVLLKLAHVVLDDISEDADVPPISELTHRLGDTAARYGIAYATARELTKAMDSAVAQRQRRRAS